MKKYYFTQNKEDFYDQNFQKSQMYLYNNLESQYSCQGNSSIY